MQHKDEVKVTKSPTKWDLMISFAERKTVTIGTTMGELPIQITKIEQEDGSCESWCIKGYIDHKDRNCSNVKGYFRTDQNTGILEITRP